MSEPSEPSMEPPTRTNRWLVAGVLASFGFGFLGAAAIPASRLLEIQFADYIGLIGQITLLQFPVLLLAGFACLGGALSALAGTSWTHVGKSAAASALGAFPEAMIPGLAVASDARILEGTWATLWTVSTFIDRVMLAPGIVVRAVLFGQAGIERWAHGLSSAPVSYAIRDVTEMTASNALAYLLLYWIGSSFVSSRRERKTAA